VEAHSYYLNLTLSSIQITLRRMRKAGGEALRECRAAIKAAPGDDPVSFKPLLGVSTFLCVLPLLPPTVAKIKTRAVHIIIVTFALLRVSLVLVGALAPAARLQRLLFSLCLVTSQLTKYTLSLRVILLLWNMSLSFAIPGGKVARVNEIHLLDATGKTVHVAKNYGSKVCSTPVRGAEEPLETGWVVYASWYNFGSSPISSFATAWSVPKKPATDDGQSLFLFNSIEPSRGTAILQPVLQYGPSVAGGGSYWNAASWYVAGSQDTYYSPLIHVSVGDTLDGLFP